MSEAVNVEYLLREAFRPIEPPADLAKRLESTLQSISEMAADELEGWELAAMRDPRNWVRPAAALVAGSAAGAALVVIRTRQRSRRKPPSSIADLRELAGQAAEEFRGEARKLLDSR